MAEGGEEGAELAAGAPAAVEDDADAARDAGTDDGSVAAEDEDGAGEAAAIGQGDLQGGTAAEAGERAGRAEEMGAAGGEKDGDDVARFHGSREGNYRRERGEWQKRPRGLGRTTER